MHYVGISTREENLKLKNNIITTEENLNNVFFFLKNVSKTNNDGVSVNIVNS